MSDDYKFDTLSLHAGHVPDAQHGSRAVPIHQTTSYVFRDTDHAAALYNMELGGHLYTRISNPTVAVLEQRVAALDGGVAATATASGMAALTTAVMTICSSGDHIVASSRMYGANINLLENTLPRFGITTSFVAPDNVDAIRAAIQPNTKIIFGEVIGNPGLDVMDVEAVAAVARDAHVPLMLDCTFNTPWLLKPVSLGANILIHSLTKWMGGHGVAIGGAVVDGGNFDWGKDDRFPTIAGPHYAMNEINFHEEFGPAAFTAKFRAEGMYNFGPSMSPTNAFHILQGIETLPLRMQRHMDNTAAMLTFLTEHDQVAWVKHPTLPTHPSHELVQRMLPRGAGSIIVFGLKGGRAAGQAFIEAVQLSSHLANVGDAKTLVIHPASTTHSHISAEAMREGGLSDDMIRLSVGLEDIADITADFELGMRAAARVAAQAAE
ncbi:MAG: O-acetylhomoserine aminocarboxypropyltransferase [SAR116 cluster bacterium MED-G05]|jgi:O-acetylhomoserine (thiol)-lyase|nr:MAG: O-acetylhomoserine aminocarboxypropyltransferase [SAR116 cluster bacterium MED-G05]HBD51445.1 O-acetylhomoserine aminocarboxypropyltransferase [Alphaproteobacteria bacterium]HCA13484.1 O-acetylhomoserine aminocarboxypropyltransferase [Alphaproteobacteria bacterium]HCD22267.1 O-acetylhomoserine aminocarboxypropyltransferase [Alphaproteobacteria bacterium]HCD80099.1 O-acetylhomoserine aminocarboxypropyltransferase [Alphaproteobacteria bacterium]|tara:strand:+ start:1481 stop:2788 length:1308 start_codon:yes stop_codon:yes gene_type:complete